MTRHAKQARAAISRCAAIGVSLAAFQNDGRHGAERFDIVDDGGAAIQTHYGREWRLDARVSALAFQRFHQSGFFSALVGARASMNEEIEIKAGAENVLAQIAAGVGFLDGG